MITRQHGCRRPHQQGAGIAMMALIRRMARAVFIVGIVILTVLLLTPGDYLPKVDLWDKLEHGLAFVVVAVAGAVAFPAAHPSFASRSDCRAWTPCSKSSKSLFPDGRLLSATLANTIGVAIGLTPFVIVQLSRIVRGFPARPERI